MSAALARVALSLYLLTVEGARQTQGHDISLHRGASLAQTEMKGVPGIILDTLRAAKSQLAGHVEALAAAEKEAEEKKASLDDALKEKIKMVKAVDKKTFEYEANAVAHREMMIAVEKAVTAHSTKQKEHEAALEKFNDLSKEVEDFDAQIAQKTEAMMAEMERLKNEIEDLKNQRDEKIIAADDANKAQLDMMADFKSASTYMSGVEKEQVEAEKAMHDSQKELRDLQNQLDLAHSAFQQADSEDLEAASQAREAKALHMRGSRSVELLTKLMKSVKAFYKAVDGLESSMEETEGQGEAYQRIREDPNLKKSFQLYNLMVSAFLEVHAFDEETYAKVQPAIKQINRNSLAQIHLICDPEEKFGASEPSNTELDSMCGSGLWDAVALTKAELIEV